MATYAELAQSLYPNVKITDYGADALLIMHYGWRKENAMR